MSDRNRVSGAAAVATPPVGVVEDPHNGDGASPSKDEDKSDVVVRLTLRGITPLMMHRMPPEVIEKVLICGERPQPKKDRPVKETAAEALYRDTDGTIGIPVEMFFACLREGGRFVKLDARRNISTARETLLPALLSIEESFFPLIGNPPWMVDIRKGVMDSGGKSVAVGIVRPKFQKWSFTVTLHVNMTSDGIAPSKLRALIQMAGRRAGLGSFRPNCNGQFGQFVIEKWEELPQAV